VLCKGLDQVVTAIVGLTVTTHCSWWTRSWSSCRHSAVIWRTAFKTKRSQISCWRRRYVTLRICTALLTATSTHIDSAGYLLVSYSSITFWQFLCLRRLVGVSPKFTTRWSWGQWWTH